LREVQGGIIFTNGPIFHILNRSKWNLAWRIEPWVSQSK